MRAFALLPAADLRCRPSGAADPPVTCSNCHVRTVCLPSGVAQSPDAPVYARRRLKRDDVLCRIGAPLESLYAVRNGFLESRTTMQDGREQVTGFHMPGDVVGVDAIASGMHGTAIFALEDAEVCLIPYAHLDHPLVRRHLHKAMTDELVRARGMMLSLGTLRPDERIAAFLVGLSRRMRELGYARDDFHLRMMRRAIGSYLGMSLETVCRILSRLDKAGVIAVEKKRIRILDMPALSALASIAH